MCHKPLDKILNHKIIPVGLDYHLVNPFNSKWFSLCSLGLYPTES